jgi:hypothetical protein
MKPTGWIRCSYCYATGYRVKAIGNHEVISGRMTNKKCEICQGKGYLYLDFQ